MASIGERIREVRKGLGLSQQKFGERIKVTKAHISKIELSNDNPSEMLIKLICMEFDVNEKWIREGIGQKFSTFTVDNNVYENLNSSLVRLNEELKAKLDKGSYKLWGTALNESVKELGEVFSTSSHVNKTIIVATLKGILDLLSSPKPNSLLQKEYIELLFDIIFNIYNYNSILDEMFEKSSIIQPHPTVKDLKEAYFCFEESITETLKKMFNLHISASDIYKDFSFDEISST